MNKLLLLTCAAAMTAAVPTVHAEDAYIESDGTQFINTGYYVSPSSKVELDFAFVDFADTSTYVQTRVFDNHPTASFPNLACTLYVGGNAGQGDHSLAFALGDRETGDALVGIWTSAECDNYGDSAKGRFCDNVRRTAVVDEANHYTALLDASGSYVWRKAKPNTSTISGRTYTYTHAALRPLVLLGRPTSNDGSTGDARSKARIYGFRIYENGTSIHNYVPALKGEQVGLYDKIGGGFLSIATATAKPFTYGGDILELPDDGYISTQGNDYDIGYLYFDTGYTITPTTRAELDFALADNFPAGDYRDNQDWYLFAGSGNSGYTRCNMFFNKGDSSLGLCCGGTHWKNFGSAVPRQTSQKGIRRTAFLDNYIGKAALVTGGNTNATYAFTAQADLNYSGNTLKICKSSKSGERGFSPLKIYGFNIYESGLIVRSYKPYVTNGISGLLDTVSNGGFISCAIVTNAHKVAAGGLIDADIASSAAYIQTDGTQFINLGYYAQSDTRMELDCALVAPDAASDQYLFGTHGGSKTGNFTFSMYSTANGSGLGWCCQANSGDYSRLTSTRITAERQKFVLDGYGNEVSVLAADGTTLHTATITKNQANAKSPYEIALCTSRGIDGAITGKVPLKIYSARIYESNVLKHEFVPCVKNGVVGLWDTVDKVFKGNSASGGNAITMSGKGVDGAERWLVEPQSATISKSQTTTIKASAAGAVSYKWALNGMAIDGGANGELTVSWRKTKTPDMYTVTPVYSVFGVETDGEPVSCTVENQPQGMMLIVQ